MYNDFWEEIIEIVYDAINDELNTQEEIDAIISNAFSIFADYTQDASTIPNDFRSRPREFRSPVDLLSWIKEGGIPSSAVIIHRYLKGANDYRYKAYVSPSS